MDSCTFFSDSQKGSLDTAREFQPSETFLSLPPTETKLSTEVQGFRIVFNAFFIGLWTQRKTKRSFIAHNFTHGYSFIRYNFQLQIYARLKIIKLINGNSSLKMLMA